ncbi:MAG: ABC transporter ATP-binding protein/permease [Lachnospiraceae bacterium]|nr:ABC transporter ATP-binding protein/permease [Lachnospiraceae bacterium]
MITLKNLEKFYNKGRQNEIHVINDITLELPDTGMCAVFGESGCGKTTLLNVIGGLDSVAGGEVLLDDNPMSKSNKDFDMLRNRDVGVIFQNYNLNRRETVFDNVADSLRLCGLTDKTVIKERVNVALSNVGMEKFSRRLPDTLSGGQQQRVAIARAIVKNPKVILADEPTGNLDEANTILVMDILKAMSKERLVILVTHEADLVDFYCDTVVQLKDGRVVDVRSNENAGGYVARNKNDIFLGELDEHVQKDSNAEITYFGDAPETPVKLTVVNHNGRFYLKIDTPKVTVLDETSEVNLREGVYQDFEARRRQEENIDMSKLPPAKGKEYGKLFHFRSSVRSGYRENFKNMMKKKSKKRLAVCLMLFGAAFVFITAMFGRGLGQIIKAKEKYDTKVLYVAAMTDNVAPMLESLANDPTSKIDYWGIGRLLDNGKATDPVVHFQLARYVTGGYYDPGIDNSIAIDLNMTFLPERLISGAKVVAGTASDLGERQTVITRKVAKRIIKNSPFRYIDDYEDIIGMTITSHDAGLDFPLIVAGIVDSDEVAAYVNEFTLADMQKNLRGYCHDVTYDKDGYFEVGKGECTILVGDLYFYRIAFTGFEFDDDTIKELLENAIPEQVDDTETDRPPMPKAGDTVYYNGIELKVKEVVNVFADNPMPDYDELLEMYQKYDEHLPTSSYGYYADAGELRIASSGFLNTNNAAVVLNPEDYLDGNKAIGKTTRMLDLNMRHEGTYTETEPGVYDDQNMSMFNWSDSMPKLYYVVHTTDPKTASEKLVQVFRQLEAPSGKITEYVEDDYNGYYVEKNVSLRAYYTEDDRFYAHISNNGKVMRRLLVIGAVMLAFMCLCMYFIMKSTIMNRIREIGIYRAIGVTKKNVNFRFAVETGVVVTLSVMVGFLIASGVVWYVLNVSTFAENLFFYPVWLALIVIGVLYMVSITCGMLPLLRLIRKTPAEILAKYDI